jgi:hypothetical protein
MLLTGKKLQKVYYQRLPAFPLVAVKVANRSCASKNVSSQVKRETRRQQSAQIAWNFLNRVWAGDGYHSENIWFLTLQLSITLFHRSVRPCRGWYLLCRVICLLTQCKSCTGPNYGQEILGKGG